MNIDFETRENWTEICEKLTAEFGFDGDTVSVKAYQGLFHGLAELTRGLAKQFPIKKEIFYHKSFDPSLEPHAMALAREGYKLTQVTDSDLSAPDALTEKMGRETLCVLLSVDDPVFGLRAPIDGFLSALRDKKVFCVLVSHSAHAYQAPPEEVLRQEAHLHSFGYGLTLGFLGARFKLGSIMSEGLPWGEDTRQRLDAIKETYSAPLNETLISAFEEDPPKGSCAIHSERDRIRDRAVLVWEDIDGHALMQLLLEKLGQDYFPPGQSCLVETMSLSRWGGITTMNWLESYGLTPRQVRGSLILDAYLLEKQSDLKELIEGCYEEIVSLQSGS